jgi:cell division cycle 20-like protein 1 (cofactor of APC complex)
METPQDNWITAIEFNQAGEYLALGTQAGTVQLWDVNKQALVREYEGHESRVGAIAMTDYVMATGSRDKTINLRDVRMKDHKYSTLRGHKQEVCGLKWSQSCKQLASGGNDNKLMIWSNGWTKQPEFKISDHKAAVKAIAWSPHKDSVLVSGGGTADRTIRVWNTLLGEQVKCIKAGSQVCNLTFSKNSNQLVSTHGFSPKHEIQNQI